MTFRFYSAHVLWCSGCTVPSLKPDSPKFLWCHQKKTGGRLLWHQSAELCGCKMNYNMNKQRKSNMWSTTTKGIIVFPKCGRLTHAVTPANHKPSQLHLLLNGNKFALWWTGAMTLDWMSTADITAQTCVPLLTSVFFIHILTHTWIKTVLSHTQTLSLSW